MTNAKRYDLQWKINGEVNNKLFRFQMILLIMMKKQLSLLKDLYSQTNHKLQEARLDSLKVYNRKKNQLKFKNKQKNQKMIIKKNRR